MGVIVAKVVFWESTILGIMKAVPCKKKTHLVVLRHCPIIWFVRDTSTCRLEFSWSHLTYALVSANFDRNSGKQTI